MVLRWYGTLEADGLVSHDIGRLLDYKQDSARRREIATRLNDCNPQMPSDPESSPAWLSPSALPIPSKISKAIQVVSKVAAAVFVGKSAICPGLAPMGTSLNKWKLHFSASLVYGSDCRGDASRLLFTWAHREPILHQLSTIWHDGTADSSKSWISNSIISID
jgi:hypothetical protein